MRSTYESLLIWTSTTCRTTTQSSTRAKLVRAYKTHLEINAKVHSIFQDKQEAQKILDAIDEEAIVRRLRTQFTGINGLSLNDVKTAVADELQNLDLGNWPNCTYLGC